jgi:hypothetical protein
MKKLFTILLLLVAFISVKAADILVNSSGLPGSYTTISAAVQAASAGDRILISPQIISYQEDTLVIDKDLTLMPYATQSFVSFEGRIQLTLDSIANFNLIGFRGSYEFENLFSVINDTATNSLSVINIIDCMIENIRMDQPKTSLYLSYSEVRYLAFSHGDIIGNRLDFMYFGNFDYSSAASQTVINCSYTSCMLRAPHHFWTSGMQQENNLNNSNYHSTECDLFADYIPFGNVNVYSDTCNIIANYFADNSYDASINFFNLDFPFNFRNNYITSNINFYLFAPSSKGVNQIINNALQDRKWLLNLAYCPSSGLFNFTDITLNYLNNGHHSSLKFWAPHAGGNTASYASLPIVKNSLMAYNIFNSCGEHSGAVGASGMCDAAFLPSGPSGQNPSASDNAIFNPSLEHLNLDLTPNSIGPEGGSHAWSNYHGVDMSWDGSMGWYGTSDDSYSRDNAGHMPPGGKARITYLNLPTQIFNPANIRVKAKAVHGN